MPTVKQFESLGTSYVNLAALLKELREQQFHGSVHLTLPDYQADVYLDGEGSPIVFELDTTTGQKQNKEGAMERLMVHAREPGGLITVYQADETGFRTENVESDSESPAIYRPDWEELTTAAGHLFGAIEKAMDGTGVDFSSTLKQVRIELGDDYEFLDLTTGVFEYQNGKVILQSPPALKAYVGGVSETLRRMINRLATGKESQRLRERAAVELALAARVHQDELGLFKAQLDRIAGTKVL